MRKIDKLVIHCSATPPDMDIGADTIRQWHVKDNGWADIGYHWVIRRDGKVEAGRPEAKQGAHTAKNGGNVGSIGICMIGGVKRSNGKLLADNNFTPEQWDALRKLVMELCGRYPINSILGHRDYDKGKACPSFSVRDWVTKEQLIECVWTGGING